MEKWFLLFLTIAAITLTHAQDSSAPAPPKWQGGLEVDILPYFTGGYFGAAWIGKGHIRLRALTADVKKPDWSTQSGFANHHITAHAGVADYFFKPGWKGLWIGGGPVYWQSTIQTDLEMQTAAFNNWLLNGSAGFHFLLGKHFYLSPWAGVSLRIAGDTDVPVDNTTFTLPLFNPEASLKIGVVF